MCPGLCWYQETSGDCAVLSPETVSRCHGGSRQQYPAWAAPRPGTRTGAGSGVGQQGAESIETQRNVDQCYDQCNDRYPSLPRPSVPSLPSLPHTAAVFPSTRQRQQCSRCWAPGHGFWALVVLLIVVVRQSSCWKI